MALHGSALVLGGGGVTGVAWEIGVLTGLFEAGVDLSSAERVIGTSAGSVVGAQLTSGTPLPELFARQTAQRTGELTARMGRATLLRYLWAMLTTRAPQAFGARMGRLALAAPTLDEAARRAVIAARLPSHEWPTRPLEVTAVDAHTGAFRVFERDSGVSLIDAVGASCAVPGVWPAVTIGAERYIDGGMRSATNADLAAGCAIVVVLAPITVGLGPMASVATQIQALRAAGSRVELVSPDAQAKRAIGRNSLDPSRRAPAAHEGHRQGLAAATQIAALWSAAT